MSDDWQIRPLQSRGPYSAVFLDKIWDFSQKYRRGERYGVWEVIPGIFLYSSHNIHEERNILGHHAEGFEAPVLWEVSFPRPDNRDTRYPNSPRVITSNIIGKHFQNDWTKIFLFHG